MENKQRRKRNEVAFKVKNGRCFRISNIKFRFKTDRPFHNVKALIEEYSLFYGVSSSGNTFTLRLEEAVFTCLHSGNINATGLSRLGDVPKIISLFSLIFPQYLKSPERTEYIIDNISLFGRVGKGVFPHFPRDVALFENPPTQKYSFNNFSFPGATLKGKLGTLIVFSSGSVVILGIKSPSSFPFFQCLLNYMIEHKGGLLMRPRDEVLSVPF